LLVLALVCEEVAEVENADDVRVVQLRQHAAFSVEALGELGVLGQLVGQALQRNEAVKVRLAGLEDKAHAVAPDEFENSGCGNATAMRWMDGISLAAAGGTPWSGDK
jgi:hypothetical protein